MPPPLLTTLPGRARQAFPIIQRGVREGLSANSILTVLRSQNLGIRRQTLLDIVRSERGVIAAGSRLRSLNRNFFPDPRRLPDALTKIRRAFSFTVELRGFDLGTGESIDQSVNVSLDNVLTRNEIENRALNFIDADTERYGIAVTDVILQRGVKAGEQGTLL